MKDRSRTHRGLAALATYCLAIGASLFLLLRVCERCGMDNAYLAELFLGLVLILIGGLLALTWLVTGRREGRRGLAAGAVPGLAFGAAIVVFGATRMFVPPALSAIELVVLFAGAAVTVMLSRSGPPLPGSTTRDLVRPIEREWPTEWTERVRGKECPMCAEGRPDVAHGSSRIFEGRVSDAYLVRSDVGQPGYSIVIWHGGRHISDPTELSKDEATAYFDEVLQVGRAIEKQFTPIKMNFEMLGNSLPHLHTHVVPRYPGDGEPGHPAHFMRADLDPKNAPLIAEQTYARDLTALRELLRD